MRSLKVVLVGDTKVGKSCILSRFVQGTFDRDIPATIGAAFFTKVLTTSNGNVRLQLWDTAGQEKFRSLIPVYFRNAIGSLVVFDLTNRNSFENLDVWIGTFKEFAGDETIIVIVGNKCDLKNEIKVSDDEVKKWTESHGYLYFCVSANTGEGLSDLFDALSRELIKNKVATTSKSFDITESNQKSCC